MTTLRIITVLFLTVANSVLVFADDEAFNLFVEACRHSGHNPAEISTFQAELKVVVQKVYPDSFVEYFKQERAKEPLLGRSEEEKQRSKRAREGALEEMFSGEPKTFFVKASLRNSAAALGLEDTLAQAIEEKLDTKQPFLFQIGSTIRKHSDDGTDVTIVGEEAKVGVLQFEHSTIIEGPSPRNSMVHHLGGRARSIITAWALETLLVRDDFGNFIISDASSAAFKKECEKYGVTFTLSKESVKYEGDYSASVLEIYENGECVEQLWIDPHRGYICPREKRFDSTDGSVKDEIVSENFMLDEYSQKWFPQKVTHSAWMKVKQNVSTHYSEVRVMPGTLILNKPIPDSVFSLTVPKGMQVDDLRRDDNDKITFFANQPGKLDLTTVAEKSLDDLEWLTPREVRQPESPYEITHAKWSWMRILCLLTGIILILWGLIRYFFFKI